VPILRAVAASSFSDLLPALSRGLGIPLEVRYGANSVLHRQLRDGLPVDLLFSADSAETAPLVRDGIVLGKPVVFAQNALEVVVRRTSGATRRPDQDLENWTDVRRIAVGRLETTASGREIQRVWAASGRLQALRPKLVQTSTVRQARALLLRGDVEAAVLFKSDRAKAGASLVALGPLPGSKPLPCACAIVANSHQRREAILFADALKGAKARPIVLENGFSLP